MAKTKNAGKIAPVHFLKLYFNWEKDSTKQKYCVAWNETNEYFENLWLSRLSHGSPVYFTETTECCYAGLFNRLLLTNAPLYEWFTTCITLTSLSTNFSKLSACTFTLAFKKQNTCSKIEWTAWHFPWQPFWVYCEQQVNCCMVKKH